MFNLLQRLLADWPWKVAALAVALLVFYSVRRSVSYTQTLTLTVEAETVEGVQALTGFDPGVVSVTFRGSEAAVRRLSMPGAEPPRVRLRLRQPPEGASEMRVRLSPRDVLRDEGLRVVSIEPREVEAAFDAPDTRVFDVAEPIVTGAPKAGSVRVSIEPRQVELTGSRALLEELEAAQVTLATAIIDVSGRSEGFQTVLRVLPPDSRGGWTLKPDTVRADVRFVREEIERTLPKVPVAVLQAPSGKRYHPEPRVAEVVLHGPKREVEAVEAAVARVVLEEPEELIPDAEGGLWAKPMLMLPCTNRVSRVAITPERIRLMPFVPPRPAPTPEAREAEAAPSAAEPEGERP